MIALALDECRKLGIEKVKQNQQFVTQSEMRLVTAKVSEISVQVAGVVDWKNNTEERFDSIQRSIDTLNENFVSDKDFKNFIIYKGQKRWHKIQRLLLLL